MRLRALLLCCLLLLFPAQALGEGEEETGDASIQEGVDAWMNTIDWSGLEELLRSLPPEVQALWQGSGVRDRAEEIAASGRVGGDGALLGGLFSGMLPEIVNREWKSLAGLSAALAGLMLLSALCAALSGGKEEGAGGAAAFVCRCFTLTAVLGAFTKAATLCTESLEQLTGAMNLVTPILMTLLTVTGGAGSAAVFQPAMALLSDGVAGAIQTAVVPLTLCAGVLGLFEHLAERVRLGELSKLIRGCVKWTVGIFTTLYTAVTALRGMTAAAYDGVSVRTAKYAAGSLFPMVSGLVSGSFDTVLSCAGLVKNAAGITAILLCCCVVLLPLTRMAAGLLLLRITGAVMQPLAEKRQTGMLQVGGDMLAMLLNAYAAAAGMFLVTIGLICGLGSGGYAI